MYERFVFLPVGLILGFIAFYFHLNYLPAGILIAVGIVLFGVIRGRDGVLQLKAGYWFLGIGIVLLIVASFVCDQYRMSFDELEHAKTMDKYVRHLPGFGVAFITIGLIAIVKALFDRQ